MSKPTTGPMPPLAEAMQHAELIHDRAAIEAAIEAMAERIVADYTARDATGPERRPLFLTVMHGGLPFAAELAMAMATDLQFDYLHATRYRGETSGGGLEWKHRPATPLAGRRVLVADDILDEGHTLKAILDWCGSEGAAEVRVAVLARKRHDRCVPGVQAQHIVVDVPDRYVYGYGMDYHEQGRNLPAIYALAG